MSFSQLPNEIVLLIVGHLDSQAALNALSQTNRSLYSQINSILYQYHVQHYFPSPAVAWAAENGQLGALLKLLQAGAEIPRDTQPFATHPIAKAAANGHTKIVEILLDAGERGRLQGIDYALLLRHAAVGNHMGVMLLLFSRGIHPWSGVGFSTICFAAHSGHAELVLLLLGDLERRGFWGPIKSRELGEALCAAVKRSHNEVVIRMLLDAGADVNYTRDDNITTPLDIAANFKQLSATKLLLEAGADPNWTKSDRAGPLASAATWEPMPSSAWILPLLTDRERRGRRDPRMKKEPIVLVDTLAQELHEQLRSSPQEMKDRQMAVVRLLFEYGVDPACSGGGSALHTALSSRDYGMAHFLLDRGAYMRIPDLDAVDQAALDRAVAERDFETISRLTPSNWSLICSPKFKQWSGLLAAHVPSCS